VRPHAHFRRAGDDIALDLPVTIDEAVLGAKIEVPTLSGRVQLTIPKGTSSGRAFRLKGKGVRNTMTGHTGDQLVTVRIVLPDKIDDKLAYFLSEWRQSHGYNPGRS
jgi:DnaJ-class molecular chaperone